MDAGAGDITTTGNVKGGTLETTGDAKIGGDLTVNGKLNVDEISMKNDRLDPNGDQHHSATTITADGISNNAKVTDKNGVTTESKFTHDKEGSTTYAKKGDDADWKEATSNVTADGVENIAKDSKGNNNTFTQTSTDTKNTLTDKEGNTSTTRQDSKGIYGYAKDKDGNKSYTKQEGNRIAESVIGQDGKQTKSEMTSTDITNTAKDGIITSDAKDIVNKATGNISNSSATMDTTVTGKATESYGELETEVKGNEKHTVKGDQTNEVDGKQINTIKNGQENIISGGQTNTITGGQINNITGDQTTTITGNKTETVTENVTEDYKKNLTTTVGGNEIHEVKGTKTETVEGKLTENFKGGQETNVTGDQTTNVSGTQTTTATDINRNASGGMIDTIDNDYGTNTETKVAGKTTTDVSIKGTGEEGKYIRGANESRDYLIKGTLKNSETKTAEATSTEITDGNGKTSATIQDVTQISGSVTDGTNKSVSNVKANSIDSAVTDGSSISTINQKKDSIQSAVLEGTSYTVISQDKDNVNIASSNGTVGIVGKDIVNNARDTITNTAGTKITDTAGDSTVTTEKAKGTTFTKTGSTAYSTEAGAPTDTNIAGNHITTGRVDANELGVSDKDDQGNTADFSVKAGEGIKGSATDKDGNKTYTKVTATENSFQVQDKDGNIKNHQVNTKDKSENTIKNGDKTNIVTSTADGTTFNNSEAAAPVTGASGAGTHLNTTIKGNTITTGKVTMDYAEVMKDLGVTGKTTTGSLEVKGESKLTGKVTMESDATVGGKLDVTGKATFGDDVDITKNLSVVGDVTANSYKVGDKTYIDANGIHANNQKITDVADGSISEGSKDAVNGGQLYNVKNDLEGKVNKVGANAAAMANLHPMEFDPDSKWNIAAAIGNYGSETAAALGAFYRPNDDVMVNLSTAFGTGENMVGGGVSVRLGKGGNKLSRDESNALKDQVNDLTARMDALLSVLNPNMSKDFPDVPENHWAYEAVSRLAGNDIVQGYPDGEFHGDRTMTRYEMAEIIYNALSRGAEAEKELVEEFKPELQAMAASEKATAERAEG
ncbi:MAG: YadA-like family protein [Dialister sp.]|nr:YadA-like family protein [Dialister sp.]